MKRPTKRHHFMNDADELNYLNDVVQYLDSTGANEEAAPCLRRMEALLVQRGVDDGSIMLQDHWAVLHEVRGDIRQAIIHREREIELLDYLLTLGPLEPPTEPFLAQVLEALADDYLQLGDTEKEQQLRRRIADQKAGERKRNAETGVEPPAGTTLAPCSARGRRSRPNDAVSPAESSCRKDKGRGNTDQR